jgi:hypothetical protein
MGGNIVKSEGGQYDSLVKGETEGYVAHVVQVVFGNVDWFVLLRVTSIGRNMCLWCSILGS